MSPRSLRVLASAVAIPTVAVLQFVIGWWRFFVAYAPYPVLDDEGYVLLSLQQWARGGGLYDDVFSQYGPFHTVLFGLPLRVGNLDVSLSAGRAATLFIVIATSLLLAITVLTVTANLWSALLTQVGSYFLLTTIVFAPMHPLAILLLLLASILANMALARPHWPRASDVATGGLVGAILLTKVNVGVFVLVALAYVVALGWPADRGRRWLQPLTELGLVAMGPVLLLTAIPSLDEAHFTVPSPDSDAVLVRWTLVYVAAAAAVVVFNRARRSASAPGPEATGPSLGWLATGFFSVLVVTTGIVVLTGTSPWQLVRGVIVRPLGQTEALAVLPAVPRGVLVWTLLLPAFLAGGWALARAPVEGIWRWISGAVRIAGAAVMVFSSLLPALPEWAPDLPAPLAYVPLAALVVLPRIGEDASGRTMFRSFLAALTVGHTLHVFPVAGLHLAFSLVFPLTCASIMLADGGLEWRSDLGDAPLWNRRILAAVPAALVLVGVLAVTFDDFKLWRSTYRAGVAVDLPGAKGIRGLPDQVKSLHATVASLDGCDQFVTHPTYGSLYLYTQTPPPTGYNATLWDRLLDREEQQKIVDVLEQEEGRVCFLRPVCCFSIDQSGDDPLLDYLSTFEVVPGNPTDQLLVRPEP